MSNKIKLSIGLVMSAMTLFGSFAFATPAAAMTCNSATLTGTVDTGTPPANAHFEYSTNYNAVANGQGTVTQTQYFSTQGTFPIEQFISGLTENTVYYFRLVVTNNYGTNALNIQSFMTPFCSPPPPTTYTVSTNTNGNGTISPTSATVNAGSTTSFTVTPNSGFTGSVSGCGGNQINNITSPTNYTTGAINSSCTVNATFTPNPPPPNASGTLTISPSSCIIAIGERTCTVTGATWSTTNATNPSLVDRNTGSILSVAVNRTSPLLVYVAYPYTMFDLKNGSTVLDVGSATSSCANGSSWNGSICYQNSPTTYTVTASAGTGGNITPASQTVNSGNVASLFVTPNPGYSINNVTSSCGGNLNGNTFTTGAVNSACTVYATFTQIPPNPATGNLVISPSSCTIASGERTCTTSASWSTNNATSPTLVDGNTGAVLSSLANSSYPLTVYVAYPQTILNLKNGSSVLDTKTATATCTNGTSWNNGSCTPNTPNQYTVTANAGTGGTIAPTSQQVNAGSTTSFGVIPNSGYSVSTVTGCNGTLNGNTYTTGAINSNCTVYASFNYNGGGGGSQVPVVNLYAGQNYVNAGGSTYINWNPTNNPTFCNASNGSNYWSGSRNTSNGNFYTGQLYSTTTYTMTCGNNAGSASESVTVTVNNQNNSQTYVNISADRTNIPYNDATVIRWYPTNASYCNATGGSNGWAGTRSSYSDSFNTGPLTYTTTYTITCSNYNGGGSDTKSVTVNVDNQNYNNQTLTATTTPATSVTSTSAQLNGLILNNNTNGYPANSWFEWGTSGNLGNTTPTTSIGSLPAVRHASTITGLAPATTYYFRVVAQNSLWRNNGSILSFTTSGNIADTGITIQIPDRVTTVINNTTGGNSQSLVLLTIDGGSDRITIGEKRNYFVHWQNKSSQILRNVVLRVILPSSMDFESSNRGSFTTKDNTLTLDIGTLNGKEAGDLTLLASVNSNIKQNELVVVVANMVYTNRNNVQGDAIAYATHHVDGLGSILGANAFWSGAFLPNTLFGWLLLLLLILILVILGKHFYNQSTEVVADAPKKPTH